MDTIIPILPDRHNVGAETPTVDGILSEDDKLCMLPIISLGMKHYLKSSFQPKE